MIRPNLSWSCAWKKTRDNEMPFDLCFNCLNYLFSEEYVPGAARKGMEWQYFTGNCSDPEVQEQAKRNFTIGLTEVFGGGDADFCEREKVCELSAITVSCGKTQRRKRRNAGVSLESTKQNCFTLMYIRASLKKTRTLYPLWMCMRMQIEVQVSNGNHSQLCWTCKFPWQVV